MIASSKNVKRYNTYTINYNLKVEIGHTQITSCSQNLRTRLLTN